VSIAIIVGIITNLGRGSWGVGHWDEGAKRKCMTGGARLEDISIRGSGAAGGGCCGTAMQKTLDVRACLPRGALAFAFSGHFPLPTYSLPTYFSLISPVPAPRNFLRRSDEGSRGFTEPHPTFPPSLCLLAPSHSPESPDTSDGHASRPLRGPQRTQATNASESPATFIEFSHFNFFCLPGSNVAPRICL
jgi:hypothetical protein